jgi:hypothetical protein
MSFRLMSSLGGTNEARKLRDYCISTANWHITFWVCIRNLEMKNITVHAVYITPLLRFEAFMATECNEVFAGDQLCK